MSATLAFRPAALLALALGVAFGPAGPALGQGTKTETKAKVAKEKAKAKAEEAGLVDLNSATSAELQALPGVSELTARKIIDARPHKSVADLAALGVLSGEIARLKPLVEAKPLPAPVDVNVDPLDKLETLPGVGPALAREIVAARPLANYEALGKLKGIGPAKLDALMGRVKFGEGTGVAKAKAKVAEAKVEEKVAEKAKPKLAPGTKVNINTASKDVLDELPGIGPVKAQAILDARAAKKFEKIEDIMTVKGIKDGEFAKIKDIITVK